MGVNWYQLNAQLATINSVAIFMQFSIIATTRKMINNSSEMSEIIYFHPRQTHATNCIAKQEIFIVLINFSSLVVVQINKISCDLELKRINSICWIE